MQETVKAIVEKEFPEKNITKIRDISGLSKKTFLILFESNQQVVVSYKKERDARFRRESKVIQLVNCKTSLPAPSVITENFSDGELPDYIVMEKLDGENPDEKFKHMPVKWKKNIMRESGKMLAELHKNIQFEQTGPLKLTENSLDVDTLDNWSEALHHSMGKHIEGIQDTMFQEISDRVIETYQNNRDIIDKDFQPVLVHEDVRPGNLLVQNDEITGLVDWERALSGHAEFDLFKSEFEFIDLKFDTEKTRAKYQDDFLSGYREIRKLDQGWEERRKFYRLVEMAQVLNVFGKNYQKFINEDQKVDVKSYYISETEKVIKELENT